MKKTLTHLVLLAGFIVIGSSVQGNNLDVQKADVEKLRVFVLTDIGGDPDDVQSMIRFLLYSNQWNVEGLVATPPSGTRYQTNPSVIHELITAYGEVRDNLLKHEPEYPTVEHLRAVTKDWRGGRALSYVGEGKDAEGSDWLIQAVDKSEQPLWVLVWGGPDCLAQALWKVRHTRSPKELEKFVSKLRVYAISDQDDSGPWIRQNFKDLFYIVTPGFHRTGGFHHSTWVGISGDKFHGRFTGPDFSIVDNPWLDEHIRSKGPLGAKYPHTEFIMEGDSPSFMGLIDNGLSVPERPDFGGWGGRYEFYLPRMERFHPEPETQPIWTNAQDEVLGFDGFWHTCNKATIWRWREAYQNDFSARMDWTIKDFENANHPPVVKISHSKTLFAKPGDIIHLNAENSTDPDGDNLSFEWFYYGEAGTAVLSTGRTGAPLNIENANQAKAQFTVPNRFGRLGTMHIIVAVTDDGKPQLTRYERIIVDVTAD